MTVDSYPFEHERRRNAALPAAKAVCDASGAVISQAFGDTYFSRHDPLGEAQHVFLHGNDLPQAWRQSAAVRTGQRPFVIGELGFGTGLNFLATWHVWREARLPAPARLEYVAVEGYPLSLAHLEAAHQALGLQGLAPLAEQLRTAWQPPLPGMHRMLFECGRLSLTLLHDEVLRMLAQWEPPAGVDAWYLDGFAPARNPHMWRPEVVAELQRLSRPGATLATYTVAGEVRRTLQAAGFTVRKAPGHGRKREMLCGYLPGSKADAPPPGSEADAGAEQTDEEAAKPDEDTAAEPGASAAAAESAESAAASESSTSATTSPLPARTPRSSACDVAVVGAGIAGSATAEALARRGLRVTVLERRRLDDAFAAGGAAVAGLLMPRLDLQWSLPLRFYLAANRFAWHTLERLRAEGHALTYERTGALMLATSEHERERYRRISEELRMPRELLTWLDADEAANVARVPLGETPALWLAEAGWVEPASLCRALVANAEVRDGVEVAALVRDESAGRWLLRDASGAAVAEAAHVVLANATAARRFAQAAWMPLRPVRGQTTAVAPSAVSHELACPLVFGRYVTPVMAGHHHLGATYVALRESAEEGLQQLGEPTELTAAEHRENLERVNQVLPGLFGEADVLPRSDGRTRDENERVDNNGNRNGNEDKLAALPGRAGVRATTPDHLPLVGPVAKRDAFLETFAALRHGRRRPEVDSPAVPVYAGLHALLGLGSRGLAAAPLAAELLAAQIGGDRDAPEPWPLERDLAAALAPHRFLERDLRRRKL